MNACVWSRNNKWFTVTQQQGGVGFLALFFFFLSKGKNNWAEICSFNSFSWKCRETRGLFKSLIATFTNMVAQSQQECRQANVNGSHLPGGPFLPHPQRAHTQFFKPLKPVLTYSQVNFSLNHWTVLPEQGDFTTISQIVYCRMLISDRYQEKGARPMSEAPAYTKPDRFFY